MGSKMIIHEVNVATGEAEDRDATAAEIAANKASKKTSDANRAAEDAIASAKSALLERLGLSADEAKLLLS